MKRRGPTYGHVKVEYRLDAVFRRAIKEFREADVTSETVEKKYKAGKETPELLPEYFSAQQRKMEAGVVVIMAAGALLEQVINDYAHTFLDSDWYEEHLDNLRTLTKWILLPHLCQHKDIPEDDPALNALREFIKARNAVVHSKRRDWYLSQELGKASKQTSTESSRFWLACKNAESTVDNLIKLLTSPPLGPATKS